MIDENKKLLNTPGESVSTSGQVKESLRQHLGQMSFFDVLEYIREIIDIECFGESDKRFAESIAYIIAEVLILPEDALVKISGVNLSAKTVAQVFLGVTHEHVAGVITRFRNVNYEIKHLKTYLRTALYNSFFEFEAEIENFVNSV